MIKFSLFLLLITQLAYSQNIIINTSAANPVDIDGDFKLFIPRDNNQYLSTQWARGKLFYTNETSKSFDSLNFDRFSNRLEVVSQNEALLIMPMGVSGALIYKPKAEGALLIVGKINESSIFLIILSEGKQLLATYLTTNEDVEKRGFKTDGVRFVPKEKPDVIINEHYVLFRNGKWQETKLNKSVVGKLFGLSKKDVQAIMAEQDFNDNTLGLIELFQFLNTK